jgi:hypothetical protein
MHADKHASFAQGLSALLLSIPWPTGADETTEQGPRKGSRRKKPAAGNRLPSPSNSSPIILPLSPFVPLFPDMNIHVCTHAEEADDAVVAAFPVALVSCSRQLLVVLATLNPDALSTLASWARGVCTAWLSRHPEVATEVLLVEPLLHLRTQGASASPLTTLHV